MEDKNEIIKDKVDVAEKTIYHYRYDYVRPYSSFAPEMKKVKPVEVENQKTKPEYVSSLNEFQNRHFGEQLSFCHLEIEFLLRHLQNVFLFVRHQTPQFWFRQEAEVQQSLFHCTCKHVRRY